MLRDIDSDFMPVIRTKVLDYVKYIYGEKAVCCIMTKGTQQAKAAIRNAARLLGSELYDDTKTFLSLGDEICKTVPQELNIKLDDCWTILVDKYGENKNAMTILNNAKLVEGIFANIGMHAAGVIIADNGRVGDYVPLMYNKDKGQWMTQCDKEQAEALGLLKMDFLGLRNLGVITETLRLIDKRYGKKIDMEKVPLEKEVFEKIFATGNTNSVFQFESNGMKQMLRQFKPESIEDIILLVAAYRPGPMQYLNDVIAVKHNKKEPKYVIPEMEEVLGTTYGSPIYQEQIMQIFNKFAGFSLGESDIIRRYMSKKKTEKFAAYKDKFIEGLVANGASVAGAQDFWDQLLDFSRYAFNKSHAAAYAFVAYYTAWLKYHYPKEYLCAVMNDTDFDKLSGLINDCRNFGINILSPDVNESVEEFSIEGNAVLYGLGLVKNVGDAAKTIILEREKGGRYISFADFMMRTKCRKDVAESLITAGAFDSFSKSRLALIQAVPEYTELIKKISAKETIVSSENEKEAKKEKAAIALETLRLNINSIAVDTEREDNLFDRLQEEKEMVGAYVSAHPLNSYRKPAELGCLPIGDLTNGKEANIMGLISNLRITQRKSDGASMAFFTLEDVTGSIAVNCFTKQYKECAPCIYDGAIIKVHGKCFEEVDSFTDEAVLKFNLKDAEVLKEEKKQIVLYVSSVMEWTDEIYQKIKPYQEKGGHPLVIYDTLFGNFRETNLTVSKEILSNRLGLKASI